jgi:hypothetical protein
LLALDGIEGLGRTALVEKDGQPALVFEGRTDLPPEAAGSILAGLGRDGFHSTSA